MYSFLWTWSHRTISEYWVVAARCAHTEHGRTSIFSVMSPSYIRDVLGCRLTSAVIKVGWLKGPTNVSKAPLPCPAPPSFPALLHDRDAGEIPCSEQLVKGTRLPASLHVDISTIRNMTAGSDITILTWIEHNQTKSNGCVHKWSYHPTIQN